MNFKFNLWKTITSIVVGLIFGIYLLSKIYYIGNYNAPYLVSVDFTSILIILLIAVVTYIIWSLFQKKK
jgi:hypothetical protein